MDTETHKRRRTDTADACRPSSPMVPKPKYQTQWDPYASIRAFLLPARCSCNAPIGQKQVRLEALLEKGHTWEEIFELLKLPAENLCCRLALKSFSWHYFETIPPREKYGHNKLNADNMGIYSTHLPPNDDGPNPRRWYKTTARGVELTGYGKNNAATYLELDANNELELGGDICDDSPMDPQDIRKENAIVQATIDASPQRAGNSDLPGRIKRDESGRLMKSYLRFAGFSSPFIAAYNQTIVKISHFLRNNFSLDLDDGSKVTISAVTFHPPSDGSSPVYPKQIEMEKESYLATMRVTFSNTKVSSGGTEATETATNNAFGAYPIMAGSVLCNLNTNTLLKRHFGEENISKDHAQRQVQYQTALHQIGESMHDPMGWFLVEGTVKTILTQSKLRLNIPLMINANNKGNVMIRMTCTSATDSTVVEIVRNLSRGKLPNYKVKILPSFSQFTPRKIGTEKGKNITLPVIYHIFGVTDTQVMRSYILSVVDPKLHKHMNLEFIDMKYRQLMQSAKYNSVANPDATIGGLERAPVSPDGVIFNYVMKKRSPEFTKPTETGRQRAAAGAKVLEKTEREIYAELRSQMFIHVNDMYGTFGKEYVDHMKLNLISLMAARIILHDAGKITLDDRDSWSNKRMEVGARALLSQYIIAIDKFKMAAHEIIKKKHISNIRDLVAQVIEPEQNNITAEMVQLLYGNVFGIRSSNRNNQSGYKLNVTEIMKRESLLSQYSQIGRINTPAKRESRETATRQVHMSQFLFVCPAESPEGSRIGLITNKSVVCMPSLEHDDALMFDAIHRFRTNATPELSLSNVPQPLFYKLILNGKFLGWCPPELEQWARAKKIKNEFPRDTCIVVKEDEGTLYIYTDSQRPTVPLLIVTNGKLLMDALPENKREYADLLDANVIEFVDAWEAEYIQLAEDRDHIQQRIAEQDTKIRLLYDAIAAAMTETTKKGYQRELDLLLRYRGVTHMVMDPTSVSSISTNTIPQYNRAAPARNVYQAGMGKQAIGIYRTNTLFEFNTTARTLANPTADIFRPMINEDIGITDMPNGTNVIVAVMPMPSNFEDAFIMNRDSLFKFASTKEISKTAIIESNNEEFGISPNLSANDLKKYAHINPKTGAAYMGVHLQYGDIVIAKYSTDKNNMYRDTSVKLGIGEQGKTVAAMASRKMPRHGQERMKRIVRVKLHDFRFPMVGDKFTSRYAQKGTIGEIMRAEDMPFTGNGLVPDIIINSLPMANRMTVNKAFELFGSKPAALQGIELDGTAFRQIDVDSLMEYMQKQGFDKYGTEIMFNGKTGMKIASKIFIGPAYYQKLKHEVRDKIQSRGSGNKMKGTGQTTRGRSEGGAIRLGVMENTALRSYGAAHILRERLMLSSDPMNYVSCSKCNAPSVMMPNTTDAGTLSHRHACQICKSSDHIVSTTIPSSLMYLKYLLASGNFALDFKVKPLTEQATAQVENPGSDSRSEDEDEEELEEEAELEADEDDCDDGDDD